jgi:NAD(P)H dehydrogenase (quinone)
MILVIGAAGKTGLAILRALALLGAETRALVHRENQIQIVREAGAQETVVGDILDGDVLAKAIRGIEAIYLISPNVHPLEFEIGKAVIAAAKAAGISRLVYHSVMYPQIESMPHHWQKLRVEEALIESGMQFAILQPASYMQNILPYWEVIRKGGEYIVPYSIDSEFTPVDLEDVAEVAADVLSKPSHEGAVYQLAGPDRLSSGKMGELMGALLSREIRVTRQSINDWKKSVGNGMAPYSVDALSKMFDYYDERGFAGSSAILETLLGRSATTFPQFLSRLPK